MKTVFFLILFLLFVTLPSSAKPGSSKNDQVILKVKTPDIRIHSDAWEQLAKKWAKIFPVRMREALICQEIVLARAAQPATCVRNCRNRTTAEDAFFGLRYHAYKNKVPP